MKMVIVSGWNPGFNKVKFTEILRNDLGYSLSDAKNATDAVLENRQVELRASDLEVEPVIEKLQAIGAKCSLQNSSH